MRNGITGDIGPGRAVLKRGGRLRRVLVRFSHAVIFTALALFALIAGSFRSPAESGGQGTMSVLSYTVAAYDASAVDKARCDAVCDGVSDEVEINAGFVAGYKHVELSQGTFTLAKSVFLSNNCRLTGQGAGEVAYPGTVNGITIVTAVDGMTEHMIEISNASYCEISHFKLYARRAKSGNVIDMTACTYCRIHDLNIADSPGNGINIGTGSGGCEGNRLYNMDISNCLNGIYSRGYETNLLNIHISGCDQRGIYLQSASGAQISDIRLNNNGTSNRNGQNMYMDMCPRAVVCNVVTSSAHWEGLSIHNCDYSSFLNIVANHNGLDQAASNQRRAGIAVSASESVILSNITLVDSEPEPTQTYGIFVNNDNVNALINGAQADGNLIASVYNSDSTACLINMVGTAQAEL